MPTRFQRLKDKEARKVVAIVLTGKMTAVALLLAAMKGVDWYIGSAAVPRLTRSCTRPTTS